MPGTLVIIPTYNERENVAAIIQRLLAVEPEVHALIVDDNSPDGTGEVADELARGDSRIHVLHRREKNGLGGAYIAGFQWAHDNHYDQVVEMDADGSHAPEQLPELLAQIDRGADLVLGSRYIPGGQVVNWPLHRKLLSRGGNVYVRIVLQVPLHDITGGYRVYRSSLLDKLDVASVDSQGYCFQVDLVWRAYKAGAKIVEVPIVFTERVLGESKMSRNIITEALLKVTIWAVRYRTQKIRDWISKISHAIPGKFFR